MIRVLQITPDSNAQVWLDSHGGEIAFEANVDGQTKLTVARIMAVNTKIGTDVSVVVRVPAEIAGQLRADLAVQCCSPYEFKVPVEPSPLPMLERLRCPWVRQPPHVPRISGR